MDKTITDLEMVKKVLGFYANRNSYVPVMGDIPIWQDKGMRARMALEVLNSKRAEESVWLTEEMAALARYSFEEVPGGWIIKHITRNAISIYFGTDFKGFQIKEFAIVNAFPDKYLAKLALAKYFERKNKKGELINA